MIIAERKPLDELMAMLDPFEKILIVGCGMCMKACSAGGNKEVEALAAAVRSLRQEKGRPVSITEKTLGMQCSPKHVLQLSDSIKEFDAVLSMGCGAGVNFLADNYPQSVILPALNTKFIGVTVEDGVWSERCIGCGDCILDRTGGLCPIARCSKSLLNGPCGGSMNGKCEISRDLDCVWHLIYERLKGLNQLYRLDELFPYKDWSTSSHGGPRKIIREDLKA
ncbi:MAG: hypothetical protein D4R73_07700 [Deltaproteobacteria bacterium]|nr:MAG: hypothetical protein D4R73_07700 [Deltaproteobacteria bacterium]